MSRRHDCPPLVQVQDGEGRLLPFYRGWHRRYLESCGLTPEQAAGVAARIHRHLLHRGQTQVDVEHLECLTYRYLRRDQGERVAGRYRLWMGFLHSSRPLLVLIGGMPGSGKSAIATELASLLDITRVQSTDMLREVMRMMVPERLLPALHTSSFKAWQSWPETGEARDFRGRLIDGYRAQAEPVMVSCEAVLGRALGERVSMIVEGVHVMPSLAGRLPLKTDAVVVPLVLEVADRDTLAQRFRGRSEAAPQRRAQRYLEHLEAIWALQSHLLEEARRLGVAVVENDNQDRALREILEIISRTLEGAAEYPLPR
ncbi:MAG: AAA family ATPase [Candidatus Competibacteraceae bacterium]|nr:AAA family ATPase [Candidatus Competibacteraceae bacterium]